MAWADRGYDGSGRGGPFGGYGGGGAFGGRFDGARLTVWLLAANFLVFILDGIITGSTRAAALSPGYWGHFSLELAVQRWQVWRFFTYQFFHADFWHLFGNMLGLFFFGPLVERWWGSRRFLAFYLVCGISGAFFYLLLYPILPGVGPGTALVGASGSLFGILAAAAVIAPDMRVMLLFPPIPMSMRTLAMLFLGIAALSLLVGARNAGGEAAHLGGAIMGFVLVRRPGLLTLTSPGRQTGPSWSQRRTARRLERQARRDAVEQAEVDRILEKVHNQGIHSLSEQEKRVLKRATNRQRRVG
jgi:membrane associated rhomboid family serine protease